MVELIVSWITFGLDNGMFLIIAKPFFKPLFLHYQLNKWEQVWGYLK